MLPRERVLHGITASPVALIFAAIADYSAFSGQHQRPFSAETNQTQNAYIIGAATFTSLSAI